MDNNAIINDQQVIEDDLDQTLDYTLYEETVSYILFFKKKYFYII
jgi:hypothetical protein